MIRKALIVELRPAPEHREELRNLLESVVRLAERETQTELNLLLENDDEFKLVHLFLDDQARTEHLAGSASQAIAYSERLLTAPASTTAFDVVRGPEQLSFDLREVLADAARPPSPSRGVTPPEQSDGARAERTR